MERLTRNQRGNRQAFPLACLHLRACECAGVRLRVSARVIALIFFFNQLPTRVGANHLATNELTRMKVAQWFEKGMISRHSYHGQKPFYP